MAKYIEILADGTRREVKYNPHHDGPVTEWMTVSRKVSWLARRLKSHPGDFSLRDKLSEASQRLKQLNRDYPRVRPPFRRPTEHRRVRHRLDTRGATAQPSPVNIESAPDAAASHLVAVEVPSAAPSAPIG